jgi:glycosyltransferase involved in cell wall biosynthesis
MADSAAVLAPSTSPEGLGLAPLESLALGVPTITSSLGGLAELAPFGATVIDPFDVESFADALVEITTSPPQIDSSGVRHAFSIQRSLDTLTEAIEQAIRR